MRRRRFTFDGTGVAIVGRCSQEGGRADVFLDGEKVGEVDAWIPKNTSDDDYWHVSGLPAGKHSVRIVVRSDADARSTGKKIQIVRAVVYGPTSGALRVAISSRINFRFRRMSASTETGQSVSSWAHPSKPISASASTTALKSIEPSPR